VPHAPHRPFAKHVPTVIVTAKQLVLLDAHKDNSYRMENVHHAQIIVLNAQVFKFVPNAQVTTS
jgi:hypothetical protein